MDIDSKHALKCHKNRDFAMHACICSLHIYIYVCVDTNMHLYIYIDTDTHIQAGIDIDTHVIFFYSILLLYAVEIRYTHLIIIRICGCLSIKHCGCAFFPTSSPRLVQPVALQLHHAAVACTVATPVTATTRTEHGHEPRASRVIWIIRH